MPSAGIDSPPLPSPTGSRIDPLQLRLAETTATAAKNFGPGIIDGQHFLRRRHADDPHQFIQQLPRRKSVQIHLRRLVACFM
jgi:hypothetical protein